VSKTLRELLAVVEHKDSRPGGFISRCPKEFTLPDSNEVGYPWCPLARAVAAEIGKEKLSAKEVLAYLDNNFSKHTRFWSAFDRLTQMGGWNPVSAVAEALNYSEEEISGTQT